MPVTQPVRRKPRGYLLLEAMAGAAILGVSLVSIFHHLAFSERIQAEEVRRSKAHALLASGYAKFKNQIPVETDITDTPFIEGSGLAQIRRDITVTGYGVAGVREPRTITIVVTYRNVNNKLQTLRSISKLPPAP